MASRVRVVPVMSGVREVLKSPGVTATVSYTHLTLPTKRIV